MKNVIVIFFAFLKSLTPVMAENKIPYNNDYEWTAQWITHPEISITEYGVLNFKNTLTLDSLPSTLNVWVSADNRYKLYINGEMIATGPSRGDLQHWYYDEVNIARYMKIGVNHIAAEVWNMGEGKPIAQMSFGTAFLLQTEDSQYSSINTGKNGWKVYLNPAYSPVKKNTVKGYYACGWTDKIDGNLQDWEWKTTEITSDAWKSVKSLGTAKSRGFLYGASWYLIPRDIPMMELTREKSPAIVRINDNITKDKDLGNGKNITIPANSQYKVLLDQGYLTIGYPQLVLTGGKNSSIKCIYSEALYDSSMKKGNRNDISGKESYGYFDLFVQDGGTTRQFSPLWIRTFRYVELFIETKDEALEISDYYTIFSAYPFEQRGNFSSNDPVLSDIFTTGWRTARLCAGETYFDCPYYEQLQYVGDTRIQALISLYVSGDDRLMRKAILDFDRSRTPDGLTHSRYPSNQMQIIPPFSLYWIKMIHDYYWHREDEAFLQDLVPGMQAVLNWYENQIDSTGLVILDKWWMFVDWTPEYRRGVPPGAVKGYSSIINLQYVDALQSAAEVFEGLGLTDKANHCLILAEKLREKVWQTCYDPTKGLLTQVPGVAEYSQHANILGILTNCIPDSLQVTTLKTILTDTSLVNSSIYFKFYLFQAMKKTGMSELYLSNLEEWKTMLNMGLSTFMEELNKPRSDCHAWSASPCYDLIATVMGIRPTAPGFNKLEIKPSPGNLNKLSATLPHPKGLISIELQRKGNYGLSGTVKMPKGLDAKLIWGNDSIELRDGEQKIFLKSNL